MSQRIRSLSERALLRLAGGLLLGGFLVYFIATRFHPSGDENSHPVIFAKYAASDPWVVVHFGQFTGMVLALAGFAVLARLLQLRDQTPLLARWGYATTVATAATHAILQAVDGVALKQNVDAWAAASGTQKTILFSDAETVRWIEWGLQSYFRLLLGLTFVLIGVALARTGITARWIALAGALGGLLFATVGIAVGHNGFEQPGGPVIQLLFLTFATGVLITGIRARVTQPRQGHGLLAT
jgi:hypothetical protein